MKVLKKNYCHGLLLVVVGIFISCSDSGLPNHELDVEFSYELTCSDALLKYVTPEVTITDIKGIQKIVTVKDDMWEGSNHKTWKQSIHYDSLNVSNTATVKYIPKTGITYQDEPAFDNVHNLSCLISIKEDGEGRRNNYTIVPYFPAKTNVTANILKTFIEGLSSKMTTRGGNVDSKGEITKIEKD